MALLTSASVCSGMIRRAFTRPGPRYQIAAASAHVGEVHLDQTEFPPAPVRAHMDPPAGVSAENRRRMEAGELYYAFHPDLLADRRRCGIACARFNSAGYDVSRRRALELFKEIVCDKTTLQPPLPPPHDTPADDDELLTDYPFIDPPVKLDYGYNVKLGKNVYVNSNSTWIDTSPITVGDRTLIGPNCSFFSGTHPTDPVLRNGTRGPEYGRPITVGEDCWFGGNCIVLPGVTIGKGVTVGAGSVVTKDVPDYCVVAGNPARVVKTVEVSQKAPAGGSASAA